jgi:hypothetical protein
MHSHWASEHLLVIRTLMERSAIYRRALAPIALSLGVLGIAAALVGGTLRLGTARALLAYWSGVGIVGISGAYLLARQQALKAGESFWSAPTRRVTQALLPPLFGGFVVSAAAIAHPQAPAWVSWAVVSLWTVLYGCAVHAAGFFMPRGMKLFGWLFILVGCGLGAALLWRGAALPLSWANAVMGSAFGGLHLAYGTYLYFTEKTVNEA